MEEDAERECHVAMTHRIYHRAIDRILWLGDKDEDTDKAINAVERVSESRVRGGQVPKLDRSEIESVLRLLQRPVFRRIWCMIEAGMS